MHILKKQAILPNPRSCKKGCPSLLIAAGPFEMISVQHPGSTTYLLALLRQLNFVNYQIFE